MASARNKLSNVEEIGAIEKDKLRELISTSELKDCQNAVKVINQMLFGDDLSGALTYDQFKAKFSADIGFMLSPSGMRNFLEEHNT